MPSVDSQVGASHTARRMPGRTGSLAGALDAALVVATRDATAAAVVGALLEIHADATAGNQALRTIWDGLVDASPGAARRPRSAAGMAWTLLLAFTLREMRTVAAAALNAIAHGARTGDLHSWNARRYTVAQQLAAPAATEHLNGAK